MNKLFYISLFVSLFGILTLLLISIIITPDKISGYSDLNLNKYIQTTGKIISISSFDDFSIIRLSNNITITCNCKFPVNQTIQVSGKVTKYENKFQIQADKIELKN